MVELPTTVEADWDEFDRQLRSLSLDELKALRKQLSAQELIAHTAYVSVSVEITAREFPTVPPEPPRE